MRRLVQSIAIIFALTGAAYADPVKWTVFGDTSRWDSLRWQIHNNVLARVERGETSGRENGFGSCDDLAPAMSADDGGFEEKYFLFAAPLAVLPFLADHKRPDLSQVFTPPSVLVPPILPATPTPTPEPTTLVLLLTGCCAVWRKYQ